MSRNAPDQTLLSLLAAYDLDPPVSLFPIGPGLNNHCVGVHTARGEYVAKVYTSSNDVAAIDYEHALLNRVDAAGLSFRVPVPVRMRDGNQRCATGEGWMSLSPLLPGVCPEFRLIDGRPDPHVLEHAELMGSALGELQAALQAFPLLSRPGRTLFGALFAFPPSRRDPFKLAPERLGLRDATSHQELFGWWRAEATALQTFVAGPYRDLPRQVCHNDVAPANVLIDHGQVSALLDFEFATLAPRALDVAMGLRMVMQAWENPAPWDRVRRYCQGYARWIHMSEAEVLALPELIRLRAAIPVLWWLGRSGAQHELELASSRIAWVRTMKTWLDHNAEQLIDVVMREGD